MPPVIDQLKSADVCVVMLFGAAAAGAPWSAVFVVALLGLVLRFAWRVFQRPDLARAWIEIRRELNRRR